VKTILIIILIAVATPVLALGPSPYIGANLQVNSPTGDFNKTDVANDGAGAKTGVGGEVDVGLTGANGSLYAGYRFAKHSTNAKYTVGSETGKVSGDWNINRAVIGLRWHIFGSTPLPVVPTVGGGITIGKTKAAVNGSIGGSDYSTDESSQTSLGWFLELGGLLKPPGPFSIIGDVQYHSFDADFKSQLYDGKVNIAFFTFQLGARYALSPL
jgi:hypothetical protein